MSFVRRLAVIAITGALVALGGASARADEPVPPPPAATRDVGTPNIPDELLDVGVDEKLDAELPRDAIFKDETGKAVQLGDLIDDKKPTMLILAYHSCPVLCGLIQNAVLDGLKEIAWSIGREFNVITLSVDPRDTVSLAAEKRTAMIGAYGRPEADKGWHFLVGDDQNIHRVANAIGWKYHYDERQGQYAHPSAVTLIKPGGRVARYLYGLEFNPTDLKLGLLEASEGKSIGTIDRVILYCYHYDPQDRKYTVVAMHVMQVGGGVTLVAMSAFLGVLWLAERRKKGSGPPDNDSKSRKDDPSSKPENPSPTAREGLAHVSP